MTAANPVRQEDGVRLKNFIQEDLVFTQMVSDERSELNRRITEILVSRYPEIDGRKLLADLNAQDRVACAEGDCIIGVPNAFVDGIPDTLCVVARVLPSETARPEYIRIGFFVISPPGNPMTHLRLIARITRFACHSNFCKDLSAIDDPRRFYDRLIEEDEKHV